MEEEIQYNIPKEEKMSNSGRKNMATFFFRTKGEKNREKLLVIVFPNQLFLHFGSVAFGDQSNHVTYVTSRVPTGHPLSDRNTSHETCAQAIVQHKKENCDLKMK